VLSGKGGTGKTTVSTNLAKILNAAYVDCDVEEPNGFIFLKPEISKKYEVKIPYPVVDDDKCIECGKCAEACQFNALVKTKNDIMLFQKLCHGCEACAVVCKVGAVSFEDRTLGVIEEGYSGDVLCRRGVLNVGEPLAVPVIKELLNTLNKEALNIIDCSPGTSCNAVNTLRKVDLAVLVTEPSEFGFHDLKLAVGLVRRFNIPFGIVINKEINYHNMIRQYCDNEDIPILGAIPYEREAAEIYSKGDMLVDYDKYKVIFKQIGDRAKAVRAWS
jgi:MinD superfamily P-loop ATPase